MVIVQERQKLNSDLSNTNDMYSTINLIVIKMLGI